jgi:hypothetical protein
MRRILLPLAVVFLAGPAASTVPCEGSYQTGKHFEVELLSVTVDGQVQEDLSVYAGYVVSIKAEVVRHPVDRVANYVHFKASRAETDVPGMRQQRYEWHEYYPAR